MLPKRLHDDNDNESIVVLKKLCSYKNKENMGKCQSSERCQKSVGNVRNIGVHNRKVSEMSECEIGMEIWGRV